MLTDVVIANKSYTKLNVTEDKAVDNIALKVIKQDCPDFLLPIRTMEIDGELELRYELLEGIRLCYSSMKMSKREFVILLKNMLTPFKDCSDWFLDYHNILMDTNYIMVDKTDRSIRYVYIPVTEYARPDAEIIDFFCDIILKVEIEDDARYAMNLLRILKTDNANLMTLLDYISTDAEVDSPKKAAASAPQIIPSVNNGQPHNAADISNKKPFSIQAEKSKNQSGVQANSGNESGAVKHEQIQKEFGKQDVEGQLMGNLFGEEEEPAKKSKKEKAAKPPKQPKPAKEKKDSGLFDILKGKSKNNESKADAAKESSDAAFNNNSPEQAKTADNNFMQNGWQNQGSYTGGDATEIFAEEEVHDSNTLRLNLEDGAGFNCPKYIELNLQKGFATVGRYNKNGEAQSDYNFDASLSFISRRHFRVEKAGEQWQIIDIGSQNGTLVNNEKLVPNMAYPLRSGDRIMISGKNRLTYRVD